MMKRIFGGSDVLPSKIMYYTDCMMCGEYTIYYRCITNKCDAVFCFTCARTLKIDIGTRCPRCLYGAFPMFTNKK